MVLVSLVMSWRKTGSAFLLAYRTAHPLRPHCTDRRWGRRSALPGAATGTSRCQTLSFSARSYHHPPLCGGWCVKPCVKRARLFSASCKDSCARHAQCSPAIVLEDVDLPYHVQHEQEGAHDRQTDADPRQQDAIALGHNVHLVPGTL